MYLGVEIGGTKLQLGVGEDTGTLVRTWRGQVARGAGAAGIRRQIEQAVPELLAQAELAPGSLRRAGIGFGGPIDDATRSTLRSHQIEGWEGFPLACWLSDLLGVEAVLGNDADVAGLGEAIHGAGKGISPIFYMTIGSGIGGGLVEGGRIYRGAGRGAAEVGHLVVPAPPEGAGSLRERERGDFVQATLEGVVSGWGLERRARRVAREQPGRSRELVALAGGSPEAITVANLGEAARRGDPLACGILGILVGVLAVGLARVITLLAPRRIILGGGVSLLGEELLFEPLRRELQGSTSGNPFAERAFPSFLADTEVVPAALGEEVVLHGAIALAARAESAPQR